MKPNRFIGVSMKVLSQQIKGWTEIWLPDWQTHEFWPQQQGLYVHAVRILSYDCLLLNTCQHTPLLLEPSYSRI